MNEVTLKLHPDNVVKVLNGLAELPFKHVNTLITDIMKQMDEQEKAAATSGSKGISAEN